MTESGIRESIEMGCYGIGTGRLLAAIIEQNHDDKGPIFPKSISPYNIIITALNIDDLKVEGYSKEIYNLLIKSGFSTVLDDRNESPGVKFSVLIPLLLNKVLLFYKNQDVYFQKYLQPYQI